MTRSISPQRQNVLILKRFLEIRRLAALAIIVTALLWPAAYSFAAEQDAPGSFSLVDHTGRAVSNADYLGKFMLVFFGYTYCPDICPTDLQVMSEALDILGEAANKVQPIFITVDPKRDPPEVLADYVSSFHPNLIGLTGTSEQIADAAWEYNVRYFKVFATPAMGGDENETGKTGNNENNDYSISHSALIYLVNPKGHGLAAFEHGISPEELAKEISSFISASP